MSERSASFVPQFESRLWAESHKAGHPAILSGAEIPIYRGNHAISDADELLNSYSLLLNSEVIAIDPNYYRPTEVDLLIGDPAKAKVYPPTCAPLAYF